MNVKNPTASADERDPSACLLRLVVAAALLLPAPVAAAQVLGIADGPHYADAIGHAMLTFVIWLSVPAAYGATRFLRSQGALPVVIALIAATASLGSTIWLVRPQAPEGRSHQESLSEGQGMVRLELGAILDRAAPGRASVQHGGASDCTDVFGRTRNAAIGVVTFEITGGLSLEELDSLVAALRGAGWTAEVVDVDFLGGPGRRVEAEHNGYGLRTWGTFIDPKQIQPTDVYAWTPCLRR